jgi:hypothetical protein
MHSMQAAGIGLSVTARLDRRHHPTSVAPAPRDSCSKPFASNPGASNPGRRRGYWRCTVIVCLACRALSDT